ncbi:MAG: ATP-binding protein [Rubrivivax sp.]|nr:ATP-binding protein [Rubrivivax sp.]
MLCVFAVVGGLGGALGAAAAPPPQTLEPAAGQVLLSSSITLPAGDAPGWTATELPDGRDATVAWYRVPFDLVGSGETWMLYLPYFYGGGRIWLNGVPVATVPESSAARRVRWERPLLLPLPPSALRPGANVLQLRVVADASLSGLRMPSPVLGPQEAVQPLFDRRLLLVRTVPFVTVISGTVVALLVLFIWFRRRQEVAYGLFGLAALLWALRTTTFVFDAMPMALWPYWRALYYACTGGYIAVLALFVLSMAGWFQARWAWALLAYVAAGPLLFFAGGAQGDEWVGRWWVLGLIPMGLAVVGVSAATAWRTRGVGAVLVFAAVLLALLAGIHDYAVGISLPALEVLLPRWSGQRIFLLHHVANLLLVVMGALLALRFVQSLQAVEEANATLQARVAQRERELAAGYERIAALQREQATQEERQRIMQELHDGVGAHLVSTLMRAQRGELSNPAMSDAMRGAIDEMRVAIEALTGEDGDLGAAFANFRFRWDARLREAGLAPRWEVELPEEGLRLPPHDTLQLLRVAQEALVNVLKHAHARHVWVRLVRETGQLRLEVADDGRGLPPGPGPAGEAAAPGAVPELAGGRGLSNMRARAVRLKAQFTVASGSGQAAGVPLPGLHLALVIPLA